jgi:hypothetical protein
VLKSTYTGPAWLWYLHHRLDEREVPLATSALAEVDPSLWSKSHPLQGRTPDQPDSRLAATRLQQVDRDDSLRKFPRPDMLPGEYHLARVEGWILGVM